MATNLRPGQLIDRKYKILELIATGSIGAVYKAEHASFKGRICAIKFFSPSLQCNPTLRADLFKRFINEAKVLEGLSRNTFSLPRVHDLNERKTKSHPPYYVMDCVMDKTGTIRTLADIKGDNLDWCEENIARWFLDVAKALQYLHGKNIIHQDVKPNNILINESGHAVLVDFGVIKITGKGLANELGVQIPHSDNSQWLYGTEPLLSPELTQGTGSASSASDVYALAGTFLKLLRNEYPLSSVNYRNGWDIFEDRRWEKVIPAMLCPNPDNRMSISKCIEVFSSNTIAEDPEPPQSSAQNGIPFALHDELERLRNSMHRFASKYNELRWSDAGTTYEKERVLSRIYQKYRLRELTLLKQIFQKPSRQPRHAIVSLQDKLRILDQQFLHDFKAAKLTPMIDILVEILNLDMWPVLKSADERTRNDNVVDKCISFLRDYLSPEAQFIFGKYRHLAWELESQLANNVPKTYRGEALADMLFLYERTLIMYTPSNKNLATRQAERLKHRNELESLDSKGLALDLARIRARPTASQN